MNYLAYGGGTNSTALAIGCVRRGIPIDAIAFADTGGEHPHTYRYVDMFSDWLVSHGQPAIVRVRLLVHGKPYTLEEDCLRRKALPSPAYGGKTCSDRWKQRPQRDYLESLPEAKAVWSRGEKITKLIGFDADEPGRAQPFSDERFINRYLLVEWGMGREECVEAIRSEGLPLPGKSSCFFCPNMKRHEIRDLYDRYPALFRRALEMEKNAELTDMKGLDRNHAWAEYEPFFRDQMEMPFIERPKEDCPPCFDGISPSPQG